MSVLDQLVAVALERDPRNRKKALDAIRKDSRLTSEGKRIFFESLDQEAVARRRRRELRPVRSRRGVSRATSEAE